jgi:hypothetical protein
VAVAVAPEATRAPAAAAAAALQQQKQLQGQQQHHLIWYSNIPSLVIVLGKISSIDRCICVILPKDDLSS